MHVRSGSNSLYPPQRSCMGVYWFHHVRPSVDKSYVVRVLLLESSLKRHVTSKREYHKDKMAGLSR